MTHDFTKLVENAIDYLDRSVDDLVATDIKYSVVHFFHAVELFLKARLYLEHWTLILADPSNADRTKFDQGDFQSVNLREAAKRLHKIVGEDVSRAEQAFSPIRQRRNRVIHFFAPHHPVAPRASTRPPRIRGTRDIDSAAPEVAELVAEQCLAWHELHALIRGRWRHHFRAFGTQIDRLNEKMLKLRPYLETRFTQLADEIARTSRTHDVVKCFACGYKAARESEVFEGLVETECLVCLRRGREYRMPCPDDGCNGVVVLAEGLGECSVCEATFSLEEMVDLLISPCSSRDPDDFSHGYCGYCESLEESSGTVVRIDHVGEYLCVSCLESDSDLQVCEWCSELVMGLKEESYLTGCMNCGGRLGYDDD